MIDHCHFVYPCLTLIRYCTNVMYRGLPITKKRQVDTDSFNKKVFMN